MNIKRATALVFSLLCMAAVFSACSAGSGPEGKYISVAATVFDRLHTGSEVEGFTLDLSKGGKGTFDIDGETYDIEWSVKDGEISITNEQGTMTGEIEKDVIRLNDIGGSGMSIVFAREGSDAADPVNYLTDEEKLFVGAWKSDAVYDALGSDASDKVSPNALTIDIRSDKTASVTFADAEPIEGRWSVFDDMGIMEDVNVTFTLKEDGTLSVNYVEKGQNLTFYCAQ
ncbi:MAG: hypothetical protein IJG50_06120 [Clostridia bacterium]|nr:hypothetical protein [Clostridia bacterium]